MKIWYRAMRCIWIVDGSGTNLTWTELTNYTILHTILFLQHSPASQNKQQQTWRWTTFQYQKTWIKHPNELDLIHSSKKETFYQTKVAKAWNMSITYHIFRLQQAFHIARIAFYTRNITHAKTHKGSGCRWATITPMLHTTKQKYRTTNRHETQTSGRRKPQKIETHRNTEPLHTTSVIQIRNSLASMRYFWKDKRQDSKTYRSADPCKIQIVEDHQYKKMSVRTKGFQIRD